MDYSSLILGLAGIFSTLLTSGLALYFTYKDRNSGYRESLFDKQVEYIINCFEQVNTVQRLINIHQDKINKPVSKQVWDDFLVEAEKLSTLVDKSSSILPTEIYTTLAEFNNVCEKYIVAKKQQKLNSFKLQDMHALNLKFALTSREYIGVDPLSEENLKLTTEGNFETLIEMPDSSWNRFAEELSNQNKN